jgi:acyl-lipid omega-6 desaturase (Delta-12 desaturase)
MNDRFSISARPPLAATDVSKENVTRFGTVSVWRAWWQVANSFVPYAVLWVAMVYALAVSYWLILPIAILAAGFLARIFIIFHDCGHAILPVNHCRTLGSL